MIVSKKQSVIIINFIYDITNNQFKDRFFNFINEQTFYFPKLS